MKTISAVPGRIRLKVEKLYHNQNLAEIVEFYLQTLEGVKSSSANPVIGTVVVIYDPVKVSSRGLVQKVQELIETETEYLHYLRENYLDYFREVQKLRKARQRLFFFAGLYVLFKIKRYFFGKFTLSESLPVLQIAAIVTVASNYPVLQRKVKQYFPGGADKALLFTGVALTLVREGGKGILLLTLKAYTDSLQAASALEVKKQLLLCSPNKLTLVWCSQGGESAVKPVKLLQAGDIINLREKEVVPATGQVLEGEGFVNCMYCTGETGLRRVQTGDEVLEGMVLAQGKVQIVVQNSANFADKPDLDLTKLRLYREVSDYQEKAIYLASAAAIAGYFVTGTFFNTLAVFLVLNPTAARISLESGIARYIRELLHQKILVRNVKVLEKLPHIRCAVFDKTGTLTNVKSGVECTESVVRGAFRAVWGLKKVGVAKVVILSGDKLDNVQKVARQLEVDEAYGTYEARDKAEYIKYEKKVGPVLMVGDGLNDIPAMQAADVSISFRGASAKAVWHADCLLLDKELEKIPDLISFTAASYVKIRHNLRFTRWISAGLGLYTATGALTLFQAESYNVMNALWAALSGLRIGKSDLKTIKEILNLQVGLPIQQTNISLLSNQKLFHLNYY